MAMPRSFPFPREGNARKDRTLVLRRNDSFSPVLALVALGLDGFERAGSGVERLLGLALSGGRVGDRLRRREPVRPGAQQPVVGGRRGVARQRSGGRGVPGDAGCQSFHWSGHGGAGPAAGLGRDAGSGRGGRRKCRVVHHRAEMDHWGLLPLLHGHAHHRPAAGGFGNLASAQAIRRRFNRCRADESRVGPPGAALAAPNAQRLLAPVPALRR